MISPIRRFGPAYMCFVIVVLILDLIFNVTSDIKQLISLTIVDMQLCAFPFVAMSSRSKSTRPYDIAFILLNLLALIIAYALVYKANGLFDTHINAQTSDPVECFYFSVVTWTTLGYGDLIPVGKVSHLAAASEALTGYIGMAGLIALMVIYASDQTDEGHETTDFVT